MYVKRLLLILACALILPTPLLAQAPNALPPAHIVPAVSEGIVACQAGDTVEVSGAFAMTQDFDTCVFQADGVTLASRGPAAGSDPYHFEWPASTVGEHRLEVVYSGQGARKTIGRQVIVLVSATPPVVFTSLPAKAGVDAPVTVAGTREFAAARVAFYFDGALVSTTTTQPFTATLPITAKKSGSYPLRVVAYDAIGRAGYSRTAQIEVPARITVSAPATFALQKPEDRAALTVDIPPDVKAAKVAYFWETAGSDDWQPLAEESAAPFSHAFDLSAFADGDYAVKATLTIASGQTYDSVPAPLTFQNALAADTTAKAAQAKADADALAQAAAAKKQADADALVADAAHLHSETAANLLHFLPRPGYDEKIFRKQIAELALASTDYPVPAERAGAVGMGEGLAAFASAKATDVPQAVTVQVQPGSGQVTFLGIATPASRQVAQQAADIAKTIALPGHGAWSGRDITFTLSDSGSASGAAALGLADAVAVVSAGSGHAVDDSVVISGAVNADGDALPAGGVYNVASVFGDPKLHTLIVPAGAIPENALFELFVHAPALCFSRRVVFVQTLSDALKYALVGWPHGSYVKEETLMQGGLRHFAAGQDTLALAAFSAARDLDPGNWTAGFWTTMVQLVDQQRLPIKSPAKVAP